MTYSKKTLYIIKKLDAVHGAIQNIKKESCGTSEAKQLSSILVKRLNSERHRLIQELEQIANAKSFRAAGRMGLPVQQGMAASYARANSRRVAAQALLH